MHHSEMSGVVLGNAEKFEIVFSNFLRLKISLGKKDSKKLKLL